MLLLPVDDECESKEEEGNETNEAVRESSFLHNVIYHRSEHQWQQCCKNISQFVSILILLFNKGWRITWIDFQMLTNLNLTYKKTVWQPRLFFLMSCWLFRLERSFSWKCFARRQCHLRFCTFQKISLKITLQYKNKITKIKNSSNF